VERSISEPGLNGEVAPIADLPVLAAERAGSAHVALPWIHRLFSNLKRWGLGVYHGLRKTNLQHYLDEFVFRFKRRRTRHAAFDTLLGIGARTAPAPYRVLIRKAA
jgi:hypothetical protein